MREARHKCERVVACEILARFSRQLLGKHGCNRGVVEYCYSCSNLYRRFALAVIFFYLQTFTGASSGRPCIPAAHGRTRQPLTEVGTNHVYMGHRRCLPLPASRTPGAPMTFYVGVFIPNPPPRSSVLITWHVLSYILIRRTRMIQLRSLCSKGICQGICSHWPPQGPMMSHNGIESNMQTSRPERFGYHGIPVPIVRPPSAMHCRIARVWDGSDCFFPSFLKKLLSLSNAIKSIIGFY